jgi:starch-binding outer membrane protein, SusD/RagB family
LDQNQRNGIHPYRPGILYRLGEAYLNYAEALNECDPGNPDILKYLNLIRERAGMPQYGTGKDSNGFDKIPLNGQDEVREAIYHERRVELCCENGLRYLDLRRWKKAEEVLNQPMYGMNFSGTKLSDDPNDDAAFFKRTQYIKRVYERKFYWYPIYQDQIDKDPTLVQAPFWDK